MRRFALAMLRMLGVIALAMAAFAVPAMAQDNDDDTEGDDVVVDTAEFAVFIYAGTVDDFSQDPVDQAGALEFLTEYDDQEDEIEHVWQAISDDESRPDPFYGEDGETTLSLDELTSEPHVLVVHAGEEVDEPVISAGNIEGTVDDGTLTIDLEQVDESGYEGRAFFGPNDADAENIDEDESGDADIDREDPDRIEDDDRGQTGVIIGLWQAATTGA